MRPRQATFPLPARTPAPPATPGVSPEWPPLPMRWLVLFCWPQTPNNNHLRSHPLHLLRGLFLMAAGRPYPPALPASTRVFVTKSCFNFIVIFMEGNRLPTEESPLVRGPRIRFM